MAEFLDLIIQIGIVLFFLALGYGVGHRREKKHIEYLDAKEREFQGIGIISHKRLRVDGRVECRGIVTGCVVIATDYFKVFASALRNLFGGELRSFETLVARARREAIVRMLAEAKELGANAIINVRLETSTIGGQQKKKSGGVEVLVYGTALYVAEQASA